jgi:hypothetical protein
MKEKTFKHKMSEMRRKMEIGDEETSEKGRSRRK